MAHPGGDTQRRHLDLTFARSHSHTHCCTQASGRVHGGNGLDCAFGGYVGLVVYRIWS